MGQKIRCANSDCRRLFLPNPRVKNHRYCDKKDCQRARKTRWQRQKMKADPLYQKDQRDAQQCWMEQNPHYWRRYRSQHPEYGKRNRLLQRERDRKRRIYNLAKMDVSESISLIEPGPYYVIFAKEDLAKMDTLQPRYYLIPET